MEIATENLTSNSEHWASIDGYRNYEVSWWGRVRNNKTARILKGKLNPNGYMSVNLHKRGSKQKTHFIHQLVAREWVPNPEQKRCVDHIDGSRTNNNWENLRYATHSENSRNQKRHSDGSSIYKGVSWDKLAKKWRAQINILGRVINLGGFTDERAAAVVYNAAALEHFKEYAKLNELD
jgi:hypothetical protein